MSVKALDINSTAENIVTAIDEIVIATTYNGNTNTSDKITIGELSILTSSLKKIATLLPSLVSNDTVTDGFMDCVDNLIDDTNSDAWKSETDSTNAEQILSAIDSIAEALTVTAEQDGKRLITKKNIAIQAQLFSDCGMIFPDSFESFDQDWINQAKSSIRIQSQSLSNSTEAYVVTAAIYRNMSDILPNTYYVTNENRSEKKDDTEKKVKINGPVLAMTIPSHLSRSLDSPITITFEHYNNNLTAPVCVFWQYQSDSQGFWSDDGCRINSTNASSTVCECNHLTNFAVLMSPFQQVDEVGSSSESMVLHIVSIVGISTSILCLIATIVIHFALWK
ncbi:adhesion G protein-coupled receptor E3-like [Mercenaria mercenaria]|uniref:adhesion G protein-coupled receptor E3-like n=1 Tax=Mercenaria mercenaria TaxID=6596 RepID=UPI00234EE535|nr:adhesion G protein-coupled receptor E3-like [Mercenaria mercenaria]